MHLLHDIVSLCLELLHALEVTFRSIVIVVEGEPHRRQTKPHNVMTPAARIEELQKLRADRRIRDLGSRQYEQHVAKVANHVSTIKQQELVKLVEDGSIDALDPYLDTIPYIAALNYSMRGLIHGKKNIPDQLKPGAPLWRRTVTFLHQCNPIEIRATGRQWNELVAAIIESAQFAPTDGQVGTSLRCCDNTILISYLANTCLAKRFNRASTS